MARIQGRISLDQNGDPQVHESSSLIVPPQSPRKNRLLLTWKGINYSVTAKGKSTKILKGLSGFAKPGELLAIMGTSGCGKTSLLNVLSNQIILHRGAELSGTVEINEESIKKIDYTAFARYVLQQDILMASQTAREALIFAAVLKVGGKKEAIKAAVEQILTDLKLEKVADNLIGDEFIKGLSGGEKKRVSIGIELIAEPSILILDEPTSGLDSVTATVVIHLLKAQADKGKTIITTIHQPSSSIFQSFDRLILMVEGSFIYQGPANASIDYFNQIGYSCPELTNPPDYYMRIMYIENRNDLKVEESEKLEKFIQAYKENEYETLSDCRNAEVTALNVSSKAYKAGFLIEFRELCRRSFVNTLRNPMLLMVKIMQGIVIGFITDILFRDLGYGFMQVQDRLGVMQFLVINAVFFGSNSSAITFVGERQLFLKDYKEGVYGTNAFYLAKVVSELPAQIMFSTLTVIVIYFAVDFNRHDASKFFIFLSVFLLVHLAGCLYGNLGGALSPNLRAATIIGPTIVAPLMMFGGYFSNESSLSKAFYWIKYLSAFNFGFESLAINELTDLPIVMSEFRVPPLQTLGFTGELWKSVCPLLLIDLGCILLTLSTLKITGNSYKHN